MKKSNSIAMNRLYFLLLLLPVLFLAACEQSGEVTVNMEYQDPVVTVTEISPELGYAGDRLTVTGTDFGAAKDFIKVFIGDDQAKTISCTDKKIVVEIPEGTTTGKVSVRLLEQKITTEMLYKVLGKPSVETITPLWGFVGDQVTFGGSELGIKQEDIQLLFGKSTTSANIVSWTSESFVVELPDDATSGKVTLNIATQKGVNTPSDFTVREHAELTAITPATAYKNSVITITGSNFGTNKEGVTVLFGTKAGVVISCTEEKIEVTVPMDSAEGAVEVTVETPYEKVAGKLIFNITPTPIVVGGGVSPSSGYIGSEVTISGTKMPANVADMVVKFGETQINIAPADYTVDASGNGELKVKVPSGLSEGVVTMTLTIAGLEIYTGSFTVLPTPSVDTFTSRMVKVGQNITLTGSEFVTNTADVEVNFGGTAVNPTAISSTQMSVTVPAGFSGGGLGVTFKNIPSMAVGNLTVLAVGDITEQVIKNYKQPFARLEATATEWATATDWLYNDTFLGNGGTLQYPSKNGDIPTGIIALLKWGKANQNGKMWQTMSLPKGKYKATLNVARCGSNSGRFRAYFIIGNGSGVENIPDLNAPNDWIGNIPASILNSYEITSVKSETAVVEELNFELTDEQSDIVVGFVTQLQGQGWITISSIQIDLVE